jgi:hypothetical protein
MIDTPRQRLRRVSGSVWCADNGCFGKGYPGETVWYAWLKREALTEPELCMFAVAPDVVGDHAATWERAASWLPRIRELGVPAAFVAQDGMNAETFTEWAAFDVLFIGGTTAWKLSETARQLVCEAKRHGKRVHMGRVNSRRRLRLAAAWGVDSVDGTLLTYGPDVHLPRLTAWLNEIRDDLTLLS